jgi:hypothetical protein
MISLRPAAFSMITLAACLGVNACGTLKARAEAVQITASDTEVAKCQRVGPVLLGTFDNEFDQRTRDLKFETARKGGNVLLVDSFATATTGTAYVCDSIDPRRVAS